MDLVSAVVQQTFTSELWTGLLAGSKSSSFYHYPFVSLSLVYSTPRTQRCWCKKNGEQH